MDKEPFFSVEKVPPMFLHGNRDWSVDVLRCLSCFMVCALHANIFSMHYGIETTLGPTEWTHYFFNRMLFGSPTVLFVMVSGIFFLSPERNVTASKVWKKNVLKMTGAYVFWSFVYAVYRFLLMDPKPVLTPQYIVQEWLVEPYHLWYIPMIIGLYIMCPIFRPITASEDTKLFKYIVAIFVGALIVSTLYNWPALPYSHTYLDPAIRKTPMSVICTYPFWMLFGWIAYTYRPTRRFRHLIYALGIVAIIVGIYFNIINWFRTEDLAVIATTQKFSIISFLKNTALFYFIVTVFRKHEFSELGKKYLKKLSDSTLIIYLIHMLFIYGMYDHNFLYGTFNLSPWIGTWIYAFIAYIGGGIIAELFHIVWKRIKPKKRS